MNKFKRLFPTGKPILGMLHLAGSTLEEKIQIAVQEALIMQKAGFDGLIVENYFGEAPEAEVVLSALMRMNLDCKIGINILGNTVKAFAVAKQLAADFIQIDSVAGHLDPGDDALFGDSLDMMRASTSIAVLGGVRFKYMPVKSGRTEAEDLRIGSQRCDAIVVTSDATGEPTEIGKVQRFRDIIGKDMPLLIGAGLTPDNIGERFRIADGGIVGSWLKYGHRDVGRVSQSHVETFVEAARKSS